MPIPRFGGVDRHHDGPSPSFGRGGAPRPGLRQPRSRWPRDDAGLTGAETGGASCSKPPPRPRPRDSTRHRGHRRRGEPAGRLPDGRRAGHEPRPACDGHGLEGMVLPADSVADTKAGTAALPRRRGQRLHDPHRQLHRRGPLPAWDRLHSRRSAVRRPVLEPALHGLQDALAAPRPLRRSRGNAALQGRTRRGRRGRRRGWRVRLRCRPAGSRRACRGARGRSAGTRGFEAPDLIRADQILADGDPTAVRQRRPRPRTAAPSGVLAGAAAGRRPSTLVPSTLGGRTGRTDPRFPIRGGAVLTAADVATILTQAAQQTARHPRARSASPSAARARLDRGGGPRRTGPRLLPERRRARTSASTSRCRRPAPRTSSAPRGRGGPQRAGRAYRTCATACPSTAVRVQLARGGLPGAAVLPARASRARTRGRSRCRSRSGAPSTPASSSTSSTWSAPQPAAVGPAAPERDHDLSRRRPALQGRTPRRGARDQRRRGRPGRPDRGRGLALGFDAPPERRSDRS